MAGWGADPVQYSTVQYVQGRGKRCRTRRVVVGVAARRLCLSSVGPPGEKRRSFRLRLSCGGARNCSSSGTTTIVPSPLSRSCSRAGRGRRAGRERRGAAAGAPFARRRACLRCSHARPGLAPQAEDIKKAADYVAQLRRLGKGHGELACPPASAEGASGAPPGLSGFQTHTNRCTRARSHAHATPHGPRTRRRLGPPQVCGSLTTSCTRRRSVLGPPQREHSAPPAQRTPPCTPAAS